MSSEILLEVGRALSCETRLSLLTTLARGGATVTKLVEQTGASQSNVSNHLALLRSAGLVTSERSGRTAHDELASLQVRDVVTRARRPERPIPK